MPVIAGAEGVAGGDADLRLGQHLDRERKAVANTLDSWESGERALGLQQRDARMATQHLHHKVTIAAAALDEAPHEELALFEGGDAAILGEGSSARIVDLREHRHGLGQMAWREHPAEPPPGHRPSL